MDRLSLYYTANQIPVYDNLAEQFCVCDRWFCSLPGPTLPNRLFAMAGTSLGEIVNPQIAVPFQSYDLKTIFEYLSAQILSPKRWQHSPHEQARRCRDAAERFIDGRSCAEGLQACSTRFIFPDASLEIRADGFSEFNESAARRCIV